jgi:hypothetical protein
MGSEERGSIFAAAVASAGGVIALNRPSIALVEEASTTPATGSAAPCDEAFAVPPLDESVGSTAVATAGAAGALRLDARVKAMAGPVWSSTAGVGWRLLFAEAAWDGDSKESDEGPGDG